MDWSKFGLAMSDPRFQSGAPVFRDDPRMPVQTVLDNLDDGMSAEQIAKAWNLDPRLVAGIQQFAESQRLATRFSIEMFRIKLGVISRSTQFAQRRNKDEIVLPMVSY